MIIKHGTIPAPHFAHKPDLDCWYARECQGETLEHRLAKLSLADHLSEWFAEYTTAEPQIEVPIHEVQRVADVLFLFPTGWGIVHEVQLAGITVDLLEQRTKDYERAGYDVVWWFGDTALTHSVKDWSMKQYGYVCYAFTLGPMESKGLIKFWERSRYQAIRNISFRENKNC